MTAGSAESIIDVHSELIPRCAGLFVAVFNGHPWNEPWTVEAASQRLAEITATPGFVGVALAAGDTVTGVALGQAERWHAGQVFCLREMFVSPALQHQGRGKPLPANRSRQPGAGLLRKARLHRGPQPHHDDPTGLNRAGRQQPAEPNFKGFGHHPLIAECDNTREPLAWMMRPGSAGSNTAADHLQVLDEAIAALPQAFRRKLIVTCDGAGASNDLVKHLDKLASRHGYQLTYSVGWALGEREKTALTLVPEAAWEAAVDAGGKVRERRSEDAFANERCGHRACWIEEAHVTGLTGLLRVRPDGDRLKAWPRKMRVFARRERPHPGAQLTLFEAADGWRYSLRATNLPAETKGWRGQCAYIDASHRVHARRHRVGGTPSSPTTAWITPTRSLRLTAVRSCRRTSLPSPPTMPSSEASRVTAGGRLPRCTRQRIGAIEACGAHAGRGEGQTPGRQRPGVVRLAGRRSGAAGAGDGHLRRAGEREGPRPPGRAAGDQRVDQAGRAARTT
jgi:hypothetical protein